MRTLKYAILGLLTREPLTGYDIAKEFDKAISDFWNAKYSQIYPELKKLTEEGLVSFETSMHGEQQEKKIYSITERGKKDFLIWLESDKTETPSPKDILKLRLYFSENMDDKQLKKMLLKHLDKHEEKLKILEEGIKNLFGDMDLSVLNKEQRGDYMVVHQGIYREQAYVDWLKMCLDTFFSEIRL